MNIYSKAAAACAMFAFFTACSGSGSSSGQNSGTPGSSVSPPAGFTATAGDGQVSLSWSASSGASWYNIYWAAGSTVSAASGNRTGSVTSTSYTMNGLTNSTTYAFAVSAVMADGTESDLSTVVTATPFVLTPPAPDGVALSEEAGLVTLTWNPADRAASYNVYWNTTGGVTTADNRYASIAANSLAITGISADTAYYYMITAVNTGGESAGSLSPGVKPKTFVSGMTSKIAVSSSNGEVTLSWNAVDGAGVYNIYWNTAGNVTTADNRIAAGAATTYTLTGITPGTRYYYVVTALFTAGGEGGTSSEASIIP